MLPDIRAVIAAIVAAVGLLMISFALVATYRVAQEHHSGSLQADLAKRGREAIPVKPGPVLIIDTPGPHVAAPVEPALPAEPAPPAEPETPAAPVAAAPPQTEIPHTTPPAEPPMGGPLAPQVQPDAPRNAAADKVGSTDLEQAGAEKAKKARAARAARARKAAARRAAQARRAKQKSSLPGNSFGNSFGGTFTGAAGQ